MKTSRLALVVLTVGLLCVGNAVGQDEKKVESDAVAEFEETLAKAKDGDAKAMFHVGTMYFYTVGELCQDAAKNLARKTAVKWWRKAAELENATAMYCLGLMYTLDKGVIKDDVEAYAWFNVATAKGLKRDAEARDKVEKNMTPEQIAEGQKRSREIMNSISKNNPPEATESNSTN